MIKDEILEKLRIEHLQTLLEIKKVELNARQQEVKNANQSKRKVSLERATIIVAIITLIGSFITNSMQGFFSTKQKTQEFESALITKAVENGDSSISRKNLRFLLDAGLITDLNGKIKNIISDTNYVLPEFNKLEYITPSDFVFMSPSGSRYHLPTCRMVSNMAIRVSVERAKELFIQPCKICKPPNLYELVNPLVQCKALVSVGSPCKHMTRISNGYCFQHQPEH